MLRLVHSEDLDWHANERISPRSLAGLYVKLRSTFYARARALQEHHSLADLAAQKRRLSGCAEECQIRVTCTDSDSHVTMYLLKVCH